MKFKFIIVGLLFFSLKAQGQKTKEKVLPLKEFNFSSIFGSHPAASNKAYCLLGSGFFLEPSASYTDSLIVQWMAEHPEAQVIPVSSIKPMMQDDPESSMVYCWVVDKRDTLNNYLIRNGCYVGGTMLTREAELHIKKKRYLAFVDQIEAAEKFAIKNNLGVHQAKPLEEY